MIGQYIGLVELKAQVNAYDYVFLLAGILVFIGAFAVLWLKVKNEDTSTTVHVE